MVEKSSGRGSAQTGPGDYFRKRVSASINLALLRDVAIGVVTATIWWRYQGGGAAPRLTEVAVGMSSVVAVELALFLWRFIWTTPYRDFQDSGQQIAALRQQLRSLASDRPVPTAKWIVDAPHLDVEVVNAGATGEFVATIATHGLADPDLAQQAAIWRGDPELTTKRLHRETSARLAIGMIDANRWVLFSRSQFGTTRSQSQAIVNDGAPKFRITITIVSTPDALDGPLRLSAVVTGTSVAVDHTP